MTDPTAATMLAPLFPGQKPYEGTPTSLVAPAPPEMGTGTELHLVLAGRYAILGLLGAGGMGNVYRARDRELDEDIALKVLRPELVAAPGALDRFRREVRLARRVTHGNVARVFDIGEDRGQKFLTMELVDGETLSALVAREGRLDIGRIVEVGSAVCAGLAAAHAAGVVHRDLKPDNVLIAKSGRVVVSDFGIARAAAESANDGQTGALFLGTPAYMAPEQVDGSAPVDERADVYAFGAVLYELLTGERPWEGETPLAVAVARLLKPPPDPRARRADVPARLALLVMRAMAKDPARRIRSVAELSGELAALTPSASPAAAIPRPPSTPPARDGDERRVAVLPFRNTGASEHDYVADGLTEDLIDLLSMTPRLRVRSRGVVMRLRGTDRDPREVGRELDVHVVVEGSVRRRDGGVRISARLISVADGVQLWAKRFDRPESELLQVSDDTARAIADALTVELSPRTHEGPLDAEATDLYLRARAAYHDMFSDLSGRTAIGLYERALVRAPDEPRLLAGYAMVHARFSSGDPRMREAAAAAAVRATQLAPGSPEAHLAVGAVRYHMSDPVMAVRALRRAIALSAAYGEAHDTLGRILSETRRLTDATRHLEAAMSLEPDFELPRISLARTVELLGDHDRADALLEAPTRSHRAARIQTQARLLVWRGDVARGAELLRTFDPSSPQLRLAHFYLSALVAGTFPAGRDELPMPRPESMTRRLRGFFAQVEAEISGAIGDGARTLSAIEEASQQESYDVAWLDYCPALVLVRGEPRFVAARSEFAAREERVVAEYLAPGG